MLPQQKVSAIVFYVKELNRTRSFYQDALGLVVDVMESHGERFAMSAVGELTLVFFESDEKPGQSPIVVFGLDGGIEDVVENLTKKNVEIVTAVSEAPDGGLTADFKDPDGHILSLHQPAGAPRRKNNG